MLNRSASSAGTGCSDPGPNRTGPLEARTVRNTFDDLRVRGHIEPQGEEAGEVRPRMLHRHSPRRSLRVTGIDEPRTVAVEDRKHLSSTSLIICSRSFVP